MRIGIDARIVYYARGGIRNYVLHLLDVLSSLDVDTDYYVLHSRKDHPPPLSGTNLRPVPCWTPSHHRLERWALGVEIARLGLDLLHTTD
ncbi:MAG TPA: glycosyltransferase family 1 protein, partial [Anaerolineae bacterium]|nr:glycosyltransferase family 1 protein [Anaerolineae bacterium]